MEGYNFAWNFAWYDACKLLHGMTTARYSEKQIHDKVQEVLSDGFCILPNHFSEETLTRWRESFLPLLAKQIELEGKTTSRGSQRYYVTLPFILPFADPSIYENEDVLAISEKLVGKDMVMCQLASDTPLIGSDYQTIHRDTPPLFPETGKETLPFQLAINFPLVDVVPDNGPIEIVRRTHMMSKEEGLKLLEFNELKLEQVPMKLGDVMIRDVRGLHRGSPNRTNAPRPMVVIGYSRRWLNRPEVSIQVPRTMLQALSERARRLLQYNPIVDEIDLTPKTESYQTFSY